MTTNVMVMQIKKFSKTDLPRRFKEVTLVQSMHTRQELDLVVLIGCALKKGWTSVLPPRTAAKGVPLVRLIGALIEHESRID